MRVRLPAVLSVDIKSRLGRVRQIAAPSIAIDCTPVRYTLGRSVGTMFQSPTGATVLYAFPTAPKASLLPSDAPVLVVTDLSTQAQEIDLTGGTWVKHPAKIVPTPTAATLAAAARKSWSRAFQFTEEDPDNAVIGLRRPQVGAVHAVHAHWSISGESATIVLPTGTGKTETMLAVLPLVEN